MSGFILDRVSLHIPIYERSAQSIRALVAGPLVGGLVLRKDDRNVIATQALEDVSMSITEGDRIGLIGHNGAGKSSLLRVLAGVYEPTSGSIRRKGRIVTLFDIAQGMLDEMTGYENIFVRGAFIGLGEREMKKRADEIIAFSELENYIHLPLRTYSAGMKLRLAFAVCTGIEADIALLDEIIAVGDRAFMARAEQRLREFVGRAGIVVLASHSNEMIKGLCARTVMLSQGKVLYDGETAEAIRLYNEA